MRAIPNLREGLLTGALLTTAFAIGASGAAAIAPGGSDGNGSAVSASATARESATRTSGDLGSEDSAPLPGEVQCVSAPSLCERGRGVASAIPYPWRSLGYDIRIAPPPDDWHAGVSRHDLEVIELYVRPDSTREGLARTLAHEIAHALHTVCPGRLGDWRQRRALPASVSDHVPAPHNYDSVAEDFAEAFSQHLGFGTSRSTVGEPVTDAWLEINADAFTSCTAG